MEVHNLKILLLEDSESDAKLLKRYLLRKWQNLHLVRLFNKEDFKDALKKDKWDIIISDYSMPQFTGLEALEILKETGFDIPFVMVSGKMGEEVAVEVMKAGAQDYIIKDKLARIVPTIERELKEAHSRLLRIRAENALQESEIAWKTTFTSIADGILILDTDGCVKLYNQAALNIIGIPEKDIIGTNCRNLLKTTEQKPVECPFLKLKKSMKREIEDVFYNNKWYEVNIDPIINQKGELTGAVHIMKDITPQMRANQIQNTLYNISTAVRTAGNLQELFHKIRDYLSGIIDTTNIYVALYDEQSNRLSLPFIVSNKEILTAIPAGKTLTAYALSLGVPLLLYSEDIINLANQGELDIIGEMAEVWLGAPLKTASKTIGILALQSYSDKNLYDHDDLDLITFVSNEIAHAIERKQTEDNLRKANKELKIMHRDLEIKVVNAVEKLRDKDHIIMEQSRQAAIGELVSSIAHHWRQPLNNIGILVQSIEEAYNFDDLDEEFLRKKIDETMTILKDLSKSIDDFRFLYNQNETITDFDAIQNLKNVIKLIKSKFESNNITINTDFTGDYLICAYPSYFAHALLNILTNAYEILLERKIPQPTITVQCKIIDDRLTINISDNAGGIDPDILHRIFDLYFSTKKGLNNTGMGLYMSKLIIEKSMSGNIQVINHNSGAEFIITL
jgi:PAS domain S-box-containing protein